jgi:hypothetical protein
LGIEDLVTLTALAGNEANAIANPESYLHDAVRKLLS